MGGTPTPLPSLLSPAPPASTPPASPAPQPLSVSDFAAKIRAKNPGAYDDLTDQDLTAKVLTKYPQYNDMVSAADVHQGALDRTLMNMTRAMSGQRMDNPEDQAQAELGKEAGFKQAAIDAGLTLGGEFLLAPRAVQVLSKVPAGRDPVTGQMLPWIVKSAAEEGPSLARAGVQAIKTAGEAHPLVQQILIQGLTMLGAGGVAKALGWLGKTEP